MHVCCPQPHRMLANLRGREEGEGRGGESKPNPRLRSKSQDGDIERRHVGHSSFCSSHPSTHPAATSDEGGREKAALHTFVVTPRRWNTKMLLHSIEKQLKTITYPPILSKGLPGRFNNQKQNKQQSTYIYIY